MDNDYLFVCFSPEALASPEGGVPLNEKIAEFAKTIDRDGLRSFFEERFRWHWYPVVSAGFNSFATHGDLNGEINEEKRLECIGYAAEICAEEDGKRFVSALGLLSLLCRGCEAPKDVPALTQHFMEIRKRVTANSIDPNIPFWFSKVALFQLGTRVVPDGYVGTFDRTGLNAPDAES